MPQSSSPRPIISETDHEENLHTGNHWTYIANGLHEYYKHHEETMHDELNGFMTFSSIFSAVVTLFVGQSVAWLQPDNTELTVNILRTIAKEISNQPTVTTATAHPFWTRGSDVILASLISASLTCSLIVSGMCLLVKQWLREYLHEEPGAPPHNRALLRLYRHRGLRRWKVHAIVGAISMLLQVSVLLFSAGVTMVAYKLSAALAWVLVALNVVAWAVWWGSDLFPLFSPTCPFKSSLSRVIFYAAFRIRRSVDKRFALMKNWKIGKFPTLEARELDEMRRQQGKLELEALDFANREFWGSKQLKGINELFKQASNKEEALDCILHILDADGGLDLDTVQFQAEVIGTTQDEGVKQLMEIGRQIYGELIRSPENEDDWQSRVKILQARYQMFLGVPRSSGEGHGEGVSAVMSGQSRRNAHQSRALEGRDSRLEDYEPLYQC